METIDAKPVEAAVEKVSSALPARLPVSTYRLQFNRDFTFRDARSILGYLHRLGITDVYCSPYFRAQSGSTHGYDVIDPGALNPEIGTEADYEEFVSELRRLGMGQILDIVPNHMSIAGSENAWWRDVLENGPSSPYAAYFDIDWRPLKEELLDKVILPLLGDHYGKVLEDQEIRLEFDSGAFYICCYSHSLPVEPSTYAAILKHRINVLEEEMGGEDPCYQELLSIITALGHLPKRTENEPAKVAERLREKEIIKKRIRELYEGCPSFRAFLDKNVSIFNGTRHISGSFDLLDGLISSQVYRLTFWRVATEEINYRRFFDINDLAAIRTEDPSVFGDTHALVLRFVREGKATGLRVDHPDGLNDPKGYFTRLQEECFLSLCEAALGFKESAEEEVREKIRRLYREGLEKNPALGPPFYIVGEKILTGGERLPEDWPIYGTTGYSFMNLVCAVLTDASGEGPMDRTYTAFARLRKRYPDIVYETKKIIMESSMAGEINVLGHSLNRISESHRSYRDFTLNSLTDAIVEAIACFPVYRTYVDAKGVEDRDLRYIDMAISKARRRRRDLGESIFEFLKDVLTLKCPDRLDRELQGRWLSFAMKFQQITGPVMAKGIEDTAFYIYNRLVSLNEVGGDPDRFGISAETFHGQNRLTRKRWPCTMTATSTHDSKRSEDVRARLCVLSEMPGEWKERLRAWSRSNRKHKARLNGHTAPDNNEEYLLYQTLLGAWPVKPLEGRDEEAFLQRIKDYMTKTLREAKVNSNWLNPDAEYEGAVQRFVEKTVRDARFREDFLPFQKRVSHLGMLNSLSQTLLKIASPGVPDFYQGSELWTYSLVDPDNRAPVDYQTRVRLMDWLKESEAGGGPASLALSLAENMEDGAAKMYLACKALGLRNRMSRVFIEGDYAPIEPAGERAGNLIAFARTLDGSAVIAAVPRFMGKAGLGPEGLPTGDFWQGAYLPLPSGFEDIVFTDVFTGRAQEAEDFGGRPSLRLERVFSHFPASLLAGGGAR